MNAWMTQLRTMVKQSALSPPVASRLYAYAGVAMHESLALFDASTKSFVGKLLFQNREDTIDKMVILYLQNSD